MAITYALEKLYNDVKARFTLDGTAGTFDFGWQAATRQDLAPPTLIWIPGVYPEGTAGQIDPARSPGRNPRPLATWQELFTVDLTAADNTVLPATAGYEIAQWKACRALFDEWLRAVHRAGYGTFEIVSLHWLTGKSRPHPHGAALRIVGAIQGMIADRTAATAPVDTEAEISVQLHPYNDSPEVILVEPEP
jgi:hypothetical protein